jgi:anti-sigma B factor antagonist
MSKEDLQIVVTPGPRDGLRIMKLKGPLNLHTVFGFQDAVRRETVPALIVDFARVPYVDSAGLGALVAAHITAKKTMRKIAFADMNTQVKALVEMTHVDRVLNPYETVQDAEEALAQE